jgi:glucokinase
VKTIIADYTRATGLGADVSEIAVRARSGEPAAREVLERASRTLGAALGPWWVRFGASIAVVGGAMTGSWDLIEPPLRAGLTEVVGHAIPPMLPAHQPDLAPLIGAALHTLPLSCTREHEPVRRCRP